MLTEYSYPYFFGYFGDIKTSNRLMGPHNITWLTNGHDKNSNCSCVSNNVKFIMNGLYIHGYEVTYLQLYYI